MAAFPYVNCLRAGHVGFLVSKCAVQPSPRRSGKDFSCRNKTGKVSNQPSTRNNQNCQLKKNFFLTC